ncbi:MAG: OFA family MFS transporter [Anaerolineae bacterium]
MLEGYRRWLAEGSSRRWLVVVGGILINLALGVLYAWSVFRGPLQTEFKWDAITANWPFSLAIAVFALLMIPAGRMNDRFGPMPVGVAGGVLMGIAFIACSFAPAGAANAGSAWIFLMVTYGVLAGAAMGLGYAVPVATGVKWFPDKRGLVTGLSVMGFGGSSLIFGPLGSTMIAASKGDVRPTFLTLGIVFFVMVVVGALLLTTPPAGWKPAGWTAPAARTVGSGKTEKRDFAPSELLKMKETFFLIGMYALAAFAGLMVISYAKVYLDSFKFNDIAAAQGMGWITSIPVIGFNPFTGVAAVLSAAVVGWLSLWNALGRMLVGWFSDRFGRRPTMIGNFIAIAIVMALTPNIQGSAWLILVAFLVIGVTYGGNLSLFPATNADWFGTKFVGVNYGIIFIGWGIAGVIGPLVGNFGVQQLGGYNVGFYVAAALGLIAAGLAYTLKRPAAREEMATAAAPASE